MLNGFNLLIVSSGPWGQWSKSSSFFPTCSYSSTDGRVRRDGPRNPRFVYILGSSKSRNDSEHIRRKNAEGFLPMGRFILIRASLLGCGLGKTEGRCGWCPAPSVSLCHHLLPAVPPPWHSPPLSGLQPGTQSPVCLGPPCPASTLPQQVPTSLLLLGLCAQPQVPFP